MHAIAAETSSSRTLPRQTNRPALITGPALASAEIFLAAVDTKDKGKGKESEGEEQRGSKAKRLEEFDEETRSRAQQIRASNEAKMNPLQRQIEALQRQVEALRMAATTELDGYRTARKLQREALEEE